MHPFSVLMVVVSLLVYQVGVKLSVVMLVLVLGHGVVENNLCLGSPATSAHLLVWKGGGSHESHTSPWF